MRFSLAWWADRADHLAQVPYWWAALNRFTELLQGAEKVNLAMDTGDVFDLILLAAHRTGVACTGVAGAFEAQTHFRFLRAMRSQSRRVCSMRLRELGRLSPKDWVRRAVRDSWVGGGQWL